MDNPKGDGNMEILEVLEDLNIEYKMQEHKPAYTVDDLKDVFFKIGRASCRERV